MTQFNWIECQPCARESLPRKDKIKLEGKSYLQVKSKETLLLLCYATQPYPFWKNFSRKLAFLAPKLKLFTIYHAGKRALCHYPSEKHTFQYQCQSIGLWLASSHHPPNTLKPVFCLNACYPEHPTSFWSSQVTFKNSTTSLLKRLI